MDRFLMPQTASVCRFFSLRYYRAFSKVKQSLRRAAARTDDALRAGTWTAFAAITRTDAAGWFAHCGYHARLSTLMRSVLSYAPTASTTPRATIAADSANIQGSVGAGATL